MSTGERESRPVPTTGYAVLGLLSAGEELSGYDLKKWADNSLDFFFWSPALSHIYTALRDLEARGYVRHRVVDQTPLASKRLYSITDAGRHALASWAHDAPVEPTVIKHSALLRVWLGHLIDPPRLRELVEDHRARNAAELKRISTALAHANSDPELRYAAATLAWAEENRRAEDDSLGRLLERLEAIADESVDTELVR